MKELCHDDPFVITQREHDPKNEAKRVIIVGGEMPTFNVQAGQSITTEVRIERIEVPVIVTETKFVEIERIIIQKELQIERVEIPIVIEKIVEVIREVPVIRTEVQVIEKPIVIKETQVIQIKEMSNLVKIALVVQSLAVMGLLLKMCLK